MATFLPIPMRPLLAAAAFTVATGCTVRDEPATTAADGRWWSTVASRPAGTGLIAGSPTAPATPPAIEYADGFEAGSRRATEAGLPMLVVFRATWCRWSGELVQAVVADARVVRLARRFVCVSVDADRHADTCRTFGVRAFPTVLVLDAAGEERFRGTGSAALAGMAEAMTAVAGDAVRPGRIAAGPGDPAR